MPPDDSSSTDSSSCKAGLDGISIGSDASSESSEDISRDAVIERLEDVVLMKMVIEPLANGAVPRMDHPSRTFLHNTHCRMLTSVILVADFCHELLTSKRTTSVREVYYHFVTHFRNKAECDKAIWDLAAAIRVPRSALGLTASPKGWTCGCLELYDQTGALMWNGRSLPVHGISITMKLMEADVRSDARCILVVEKEGVYTRLSEDRFFQQYSCILVCGKGNPDIATRQWVHFLARELELPVYGMCDCNPYGLSILHTYHYEEKAGKKHGSHRTGKKAVHLKWLGLRPSQLDGLALPPNVFQKLTDLDEKRIKSLLNETHSFHKQGNSVMRIEELEEMENSGRKVELEALNWLGMDYMCAWVKSILEQHDAEIANGDGENSKCII
jgi:meiotic recombination protein SPO11